MNRDRQIMLTNQVESCKRVENGMRNYTGIRQHAEIREVVNHAENSKIGVERRKDGVSRYVPDSPGWLCSWGC